MWAAFSVPHNDVSPEPLDVAIIGGGPAGLVLALTLEKVGLSYQVFEKSETVVDLVGTHRSGYDLSAAATKVFSLLDMEQDLARFQVIFDAVVFRKHQRNDDAHTIPHSELPITGATRRQLQMLLMERLSKVPGGERRIVFGHAATSITDPTDQDSLCTVAFQNGTSVRARVVVGCDGLHGIARPHVLDNDAALMNLIPSKHCAFWVSTSDMAKAQAVCEVLNIKPFQLYFGFAKAAMFSGGQSTALEGDTIPPPYERKPDHAYFLLSFDLDTAVTQLPDDVFNMSGEDAAAKMSEHYHRAGWNKQVVTAISMMADWQWFPVLVSERAPITDWHRGRTILIGDAAHLMTPYLAQGASMACVDAYALGRILGASTQRLSSATEVSELFKQFQRLRVAKANATMKASRNLGNRLSSTLGIWMLEFLFTVSTHRMMHKTLVRIDKGLGDVEYVANLPTPHAGEPGKTSHRRRSRSSSRQSAS